MKGQQSKGREYEPKLSPCEGVQVYSDSIVAAAQYGQQTAVHSSAADSRPTCRLVPDNVSSAVTHIVVTVGSCRCSEVASQSGSCMAGRTALVVGGTGEVGKQVLAALASSPEYSRVVSLGRRQTDLPTLPGYDKALSYYVL